MTDPVAAVPVLSAEDATFRYRGAARDVLRDVSVAVGPGASLGLVGESGAGKSTLAQLLLGLRAPTGGRVLFRGAPLRLDAREDRMAFRRAVQTVFQDPYSSLDPRMTVGRSIAEPLVSLGTAHASGEGRRARVAALLESVGLPADAATRYPAAFSGGQRQRIAIARALAPDPAVIIADEPVSALDMSVRIQIVDLLRDLASARGLSLVLVSHDLSVVAALCENIAVLHDGAVVEQGITRDVLAAPRAAYTRRLIASIPRLPGA
jgi:ABC-type glutathione transport system ATPase component